MLAPIGTTSASYYADSTQGTRVTSIAPQHDWEGEENADKVVFRLDATETNQPLEYYTRNQIVTESNEAQSDLYASQENIVKPFLNTSAWDSAASELSAEEEAYVPPTAEEESSTGIAEEEEEEAVDETEETLNFGVSSGLSSFRSEVSLETSSDSSSEE